VVLFGQPELDRRLARSAFRQLKQRIAFAYHLQPLELAALDRYVRHRLEVAGYRGPGLYSRRTLKLLHKASGGIPRLVNLLCHKALMAAYGCGDQTIRQQHLAAAVRDTEAARPPRQLRLTLASAAAGLAALAGAGLLYARSL
jgi:MSHA biogenesis protein MshM